MHSCCSVCAVWVHPWQEPLGLGVCRALPAPGAPFALLHTRINSKLQIDKGLTMPGRLLSFVVAFWDLHSSGTSLPKQAVLPAVNSTKPHVMGIFHPVAVARRGERSSVSSSQFFLSSPFLCHSWLTHSWLCPQSSPSHPPHLMLYPAPTVPNNTQYYKLLLSNQKESTLFPSAFKKLWVKHISGTMTHLDSAFKVQFCMCLLKIECQDPARK